jgi:hypothetical protein
MTVQFIRAYRVTIGDTEIDTRTGVGIGSMHVAFAVQRDTKRVPNNAELEVWNLAPSTRARLVKLTAVPVRIEAGYLGSDIGTIFLGDLRRAHSRREGADIITRASAGDGQKAVRIAKLAKTFPAGTKVGSVISELGKALGVKPGNLSAFQGARLQDGSTALKRSLTIHGAVYDELERICRSCGLEWSVQDSELQLKEIGKPVGSAVGAQGPLLRADSGLIGTPEVETAEEVSKGDAKKAAAVKGQVIVSGTCLLRSDLRPGLPFRVESDAFTGNLVCRTTEHRGDSHGTGEDWTVTWSGVPY